MDVPTSLPNDTVTESNDNLGRKEPPIFVYFHLQGHNTDPEITFLEVVVQLKWHFS